MLRLLLYAFQASIKAASTYASWIALRFQHRYEPDSGDKFRSAAMKSSSVASGILPLCLSFLRDHGSRTIGRIRTFFIIARHTTGNVEIFAIFILFFVNVRVDWYTVRSKVEGSLNFERKIVDAWTTAVSWKRNRTHSLVSKNEDSASTYFATLVFRFSMTPSFAKPSEKSEAALFLLKFLLIRTSSTECNEFLVSSVTEPSQRSQEASELVGPYCTFLILYLEQVIGIC